MIEIGKITIEGFGSIYKPLTYDFGKLGLNILRGKNGAGKTSLINALSWCIYKQLLKKGQTIEPWPTIVGTDYKGVKVSLEFKKSGISYQIIRCQEYKGKVLGKSGRNRLVFLKQGKEIEAKGKRGIQPEIEKVIGYSFDLFKTSVLFGQRLKRLMEETGPDKKKIFEEAFESIFIGRAKELVDQRLTQKEALKSRTDTQMEITQSYIKSLLDKIHHAKEMMKQYRERREKKIKQLEEEALELHKKIKSHNSTDKLEEIQKKAEDWGKKKDKLLAKLNTKPQSQEFDLSLRINRQEREINDLQEEVKQLNRELLDFPKNCPTCKQNLPKEKIKEVKKSLFQQKKKILAKIEEANKYMDSLQSDYEEAKKGVLQQEEIREKIEALKPILAGIHKEILMENHKIQALKVDMAVLEEKNQVLQKLRAEKTPHVDLKEIRTELEKHKEIREAYKVDIKTLNKEIHIDKWLVKEPLGNAGLKAYIFDSMITGVNNRLLEYQGDMGFKVVINVDLSTNKKDIGISIFRDTHEVPYEDLSGGQKQLVDVIIAFALNDSVNITKPINILLMDEVFESLDEENIEIVSNIIARKSLNKAFHIITHLRSFNVINAHYTNVVLVKGKTELSL